ncbi:MAG: hypothetical protein ACI8XC_002493 [Gammaproteobacteria bacterium]|jgi:hypothetical protein
MFDFNRRTFRGIGGMAQNCISLMLNIKNDLLLTRNNFPLGMVFYAPMLPTQGLRPLLAPLTGFMIFK